MRRTRSSSRWPLVPVLLVALCGAVVAQTAPAPPLVTRPADFKDFASAIWLRAETAGIRRETFDKAFAGLEPDPDITAASGRQAEFEKPFKTYVGEAVSNRRIAQGQALLRKWDSELARIEARSGVPRDILVAAFGMESDYGRAKGTKDTIRSLATLAFERPDRPLFLDELIKALVILDKGEVEREKMRGSWAGAMGGPQFLPSAYLTYAVAYDGKSIPDIWDNTLDTLASIANFLRVSGWKPGVPWGFEVVLPERFDFSSLHRGFADFSALGVVAASGRPLPARGEATLFLPSGARGPAFLLSDNYWVLKAYNNSDAYALSLGLLADRIAGSPGLRGHWPEAEPMLSRAEKSEMQRLLAARGLYNGEIDGRFGQASRDAIHRFQIGIGANPADGYGSPEVLRRLTEEMPHRSSQ